MSTALPPKAQSVTMQGAPDGFAPPLAYIPQVIPGGFTRLAVSVPGDRLEAVHRAIVATITGPFRVLYRQLTDRGTGQLPKPIDHVGVEIDAERLAAALDQYRRLVYHDGRHQLWIRGAGPDQVVLEEIGTLYVYPDDPAHRDALESAGVPEGPPSLPTLAERDYIQVNFAAEADAEEAALIRDLGLQRWS